VLKKEHIYFNCLGNINSMTHFRGSQNYNLHIYK